MSLSRRDFVKLCTGTVAGFGISQMYNPAVLQALEKGLPKVFWIQGQGCTGCSVSILNSVHPSIADVLLKVIDMEFHPTIMGGEGEGAMENMFEKAKEYKGEYFVIVEGSIPTAEDGKYCIIGDYHHKEYSVQEAVRMLAKDAAAVVSVGTCAAYGGIPAAAGNLTESKSVKADLDDAGIATPVVNVPGCPPHPDWMVGTLVYALTNGVAATAEILDSDGRPEIFFGENIHENCPYLDKYDNDELATTFTDQTNCRVSIGCKGPNAYADCYKRKWNGGVNWCIENAICIGCVEPGFPDEMSPFYEGE
ncbi:MAG: NiFeSe hydrogenase small subunit [Desulfovibrio sp.]